MMFETYSYQTIKIISMIDEDTKLIIIMTTMTAWKYQLFGVAEWKEIGNFENYNAYWPELLKFCK